MVEAFRDAGTPFIVGHPGGESVEMMDAARVRGMRFILMKQETAGAMLASTWGEITGAPGVCLSTRGPGAANMVNGVAHAWMDRCPLIVITDQYPPHTYETGLRQRMNHLALYTPITKWNSTIGAKTVRQQIRRGHANRHRRIPPAPCNLTCSQPRRRKEAATLVAEPSLLPNIVPLIADKAGLKTPLQMLESAKRPILLVGLGVLWAKASQGTGGSGGTPRRSRAYHHKVQGRDPGGSCVARRLHHRRPDRTRTRQRGGPDRHGRHGRGRIAAEALALHAARFVPFFHPQHRMRWCLPPQKSWAT